MMMMMVVSTFTVHDSVNLKAWCTEGVGGGGGGGVREKVIIIKIKKKTCGTKSFTEQVGFQTFVEGL